MIFYGWRRLEDIPEELFEWVPRMEQLECFPNLEGLPLEGTDAILDTEGSVSALAKSKAQDAVLLDLLVTVYPCVGGYVLKGKEG